MQGEDVNSKTEHSVPVESPDEELLSEFIDALGRLPVFDVMTSGPPRAQRQELADSIRGRLREVSARVVALSVRHLPEAQLPAPELCQTRSFVARTPFENLVQCRNLCTLCLEEALRALRLIQRRLRGESPVEPFLPPEIIAARITSASHRREAWERKFPPITKPVGTFIPAPDGTIYFVKFNSETPDAAAAARFIKKKFPASRGAPQKYPPAKDRELCERLRKSGMTLPRFAQTEGIPTKDVERAAARERKRNRRDVERQSPTDRSRN